MVANTLEILLGPAILFVLSVLIAKLLLRARGWPVSWVWLGRSELAQLRAIAAEGGQSRSGFSGGNSLLMLRIASALLAISTMLAACRFLWVLVFSRP